VENENQLMYYNSTVEAKTPSIYTMMENNVKIYKSLNEI